MNLRSGMKSDDVKRWQLFLAGQGLDVEVDGHFGLATTEATKAYQRTEGLTVDGIVGPGTLARAIADGFAVDVDIDGDDSESGPNWPQRPMDLRPYTSNAEREVAFGRFAFRPAPVKGNPEAITITDNWAANNIVTVVIPHLIGVEAAPKTGRVFFHANCAQSAINLFQAWDDAGLSHLIKSWGGSFVPRFQRGSRSKLSNHAWGTAFDINVAWNMLGRRPALKGQPGSVRELVPIANKLGWFWGGHFNGRPDGMHFEIAKR